MINPGKQFNRLYRWSWYLLAAFILVAAVLISLLRFALTEVDSYREKIEQLASQLVQQNVEIRSLDAHLVGVVPTLILKGVQVTDKKNKKEILRIDEASIGLGILPSIRLRKVIPANITLSGTRLALVRHKNGNISLQGFSLENQELGNEADTELTGWFFSQTSLALKKTTLVWKDNLRKTRRLTFNDIDIELYNRGKKHQLTGSFTPDQSLGNKIRFAMDLRGELVSPEKWKGDFFVHGDEIRLAEWGERIRYDGTELRKGIGDMQVWGQWDNNSLSNVSGNLSLYDLQFVNSKQKRQLDIQLLGGLFDFNKTQQGWNLKVERFKYTGTGGVLPETDFSILVTRPVDETRQADFDIRVNKLELDGVREILVNSNVLPEEQYKLVKQLAPSGQLETLRVSRIYNQQEQRSEFMAHALLNNVSSNSYKKIPGVKNLSGSLWLNQDKGQLRIKSIASSVELKNLFAKPLELGKVAGRVQWWKDMRGWQVSTRNLKVKNDELAMQANMLVDIPENGRVYLDLFADFSGQTKSISNYLPVGIMKKPLINWLNRGVKAVEINSGQVVFRGYSKDFPFRGPEGQFIVRTDAKKLDLDYQENWPAINDVDLKAVFNSRGMSLDIARARLFNSNIKRTQVKINDFRHPVVNITGSVSGSFRDAMRFVAESPVPVSKEVMDFRYSGNARTRVQLRIPLQKGSHVEYEGNVELDKAGLSLMGEAVEISDITGALGFSNQGLQSENLSAVIFDNRSTITIYSKKVEDKNRTYLATSGESDAALILKKFSIPVYKQVKGKFKWQALVDFSDKQSGAPALSITSDLVGTSIDMPAPFNKTRDAQQDMKLKAVFSGAGKSDFFASYGNRVSIATRFATDNGKLKINRGHINFASQAARLPSEKILYLTGSLEKFSPSTWGKYIESYDSSSSGKSVLLPVVLDMQKLEVLLGESDKSEPVKLMPEDLPSISGSVKEFSVDEMRLGHLDVELKPLTGTMKINKLNITSPQMRFTASGQWLYARKQHLSNMAVTLKSKNLGELFHHLGLAAIINDGKADIEGNIYWNGTPFDFSMDKLNGQVNVMVEDGSVADVDPGAGRVVGLLSLTELPRRLMLDFSDVFKKGFVFDEIKGAANLSLGNVYTDAINVEGSAAKVSLSGRTGLVQRDYDLRVKVVPNVGDTLPLASGVLFGTQIGAMVYLFEKLVGSEIDKGTEREYRVTGSWEKPKIKRIDSPVEPEPAKTPENPDA